MAKFLGIELAPLNIPFQRRLQTFAVWQWCMSFLCMGFGCLFLCLYLVLFTQYYWIPLAYLPWWLYDRKTSSRGGRRSNWVRRWAMWKYFADYFPIKLVKTAELDPKKNYILGFHPHGIMSISAFSNFSTEGTGFSSIFPGMRSYLLVLAGQFIFPFFREYFMMSGAADITRESMDWILSKEGTGNMLVVVVGGAVEALEAAPERFRLVLKRRKGFIKLALRHGASLVPVFSFGEADLYLQVDNPPGSFLRNLQTKMTHTFGFSPPLFHGRGMFNYTFGILPFRKPVHTVVGKPIDVEKIENPSQEDIDSLHQKYTDGLVDLFESHKTKYDIDESKHLVFFE